VLQCLAIGKRIEYYKKVTKFTKQRNYNGKLRSRHYSYLTRKGCLNLYATRYRRHGWTGIHIFLDTLNNNWRCTTFFQGLKMLTKNDIPFILAKAKQYYVSHKKAVIAASCIGLYLILFVVSGVASAASYTPTLPDCSQQATLPATWASDLVAQIKILNSAANPTNNWAITYNFSSQTASNDYYIVFWASPINQRASAAAMWYNHDPTDPRKIYFSVNSAKGDVYRVLAHVGADGVVDYLGSGTYYNVAWGKTVNVPVSCAVANHRTPVADLTAGLYWDISQTVTVAQNVNLGFFNPVAASGGGGGTTTVTVPAPEVTVNGGTSRSEIRSLLIKTAAYGVAGFVAYKIIMSFMWRHKR